MALAASTRLGAYEILAPLGAGGMGEVYRARDSKLAREVAIKVLPAEVSADRNRLTRFEQEARSASALNHPNIVTIYEIGSVDSVSYIAMELVQGKTLRELLTEGPLPTKRLLALSAQIADGLARAHEAGIVHRDLKPDNVMITREGLVKILDFGLAKLAGSSGPEMSQLPTVAEPTESGVVVGTVGYMSPEQAMGRPVDFHSDQFSLGSILYETATGKRAFSRGSAPETLAAIIREEPEALQSLAPQLPTALRWAIERCLAKEPEERYGSTRDLARDLSQLRNHISEVSQGTSPAGTSRRRGRLVAVWAASLVLVAALALLVGPRSRKEPSVPPVRFSVAIPGEAVGSRVTVSPDGSRLAIEAFSQGQRRIFLRRLDSDETVELQGTLGAAGHFWSPDSRHLAFWADGKLKKISIAGGPPVDLCEAVVLAPGTWSRYGTILFPSRANPYGLFRVSDDGGEAVRVTSCKPEEEHRGPWFLPDGRRFLYTVNSNPGATKRCELRLGSLDSKESRTVTQLDSRAEYSPTGHLVYARESALFTQRFDEKNARLMGEPVLVADDVNYFLNTAEAAFSVSQTGVLAYRPGLSPSKLTWFGRDGKDLGQLGQLSMSTRGFRISPEGVRVAFAVIDRRSSTGDIWIFDLKRGVSTRLHSDTAHELEPVWTPDGTKLLYGSDRRGAPDIYEIATGESPGNEKVVLEQEGFQQPEDVSRDGQFLVYSDAERYPNWDIWLLPLQGERRPSPWAHTRFIEASPRFSPDGRWIAYQSDESGTPEIYVALTQGGGGKRRISPAGGRDPRWRADGRELYYVGPGDFLTAVPMTPGARLEAGKPVPLFRVEGIRNYDVTGDGTRFLVCTPSDPDRNSRVRVIVNWPAALKPEK
jgi:serine/threonine protein kinase/Tol biopolymer transport system component